jgi:hypothetical protein
MTIVKERHDTGLWSINSYPNALVPVVAAMSDPPYFEQERKLIQEHYKLILSAEQAAAVSACTKEVVDDIFWLKWPCNRLAWALNDLEIRLGDRHAFAKVAKSIVSRWPDEKGSEDVHQFIRDEQRRRRFAGLAPNRIFKSQIAAAVSKKRGFDSIDITQREVAEAICNRQAAPKPTNGLYFSKAREMPADLRGILKNSTHYPSPNGDGYTRSASAWEWLVNFQRGFRRSGHSLEDARHGRLVPELSVIQKGRLCCLVISSQKWHLFVCDVVTIPDLPAGHLALDLQRDCLHTLHVVEPLEWKIYKIED